jgi:hypothetical protein
MALETLAIIIIVCCSVGGLLIGFAALYYLLRSDVDDGSDYQEDDEVEGHESQPTGSQDVESGYILNPTDAVIPRTHEQRLMVATSFKDHVQATYLAATPMHGQKRVPAQKSISTAETSGSAVRSAELVASAVARTSNTNKPKFSFRLRWAGPNRSVMEHSEPPTIPIAESLTGKGRKTSTTATHASDDAVVGEDDAASLPDVVVTSEEILPTQVVHVQHIPLAQHMTSRGRLKVYIANYKSRHDLQNSGTTATATRSDMQNSTWLVNPGSPLKPLPDRTVAESNRMQFTEISGSTNFPTVSVSARSVSSSPRSAARSSSHGEFVPGQHNIAADLVETVEQPSTTQRGYTLPHQRGPGKQVVRSIPRQLRAGVLPNYAGHANGRQKMLDGLRLTKSP